MAGIYDTAVEDELHMYIELPPERVQDKAYEYDQLDYVTLNIAITGESGTGKSTFVNALLNLEDGEQGVAPTGVTETTLEATRYQHTHMPNVFLWDLPGIGTPNFKAKKYLKEVRFDTYDFFIIVSSERFKENDVMLAKEIKKLKKSFYFVRKKIDNDIQAAARRNVSEAEVLSQIKQSCVENLRKVGHAKVFLVTSFDLSKYDFEKLITSLEEGLSDNKRLALIQSLPACSNEVIEKKKNHLFKSAIGAAAAAGATASVAIPGLSVGCGIGIMLVFLEKAHVTFGLDEKSIKGLSARINRPERELKSVMKSRFANGVNKKVVTKMLDTVAMIAAKTVEVVLSSIACVGNLAAMGLAFSTTLHLLHEGIKEMTEDAKAVLVVANKAKDGSQ